MNPELWRRVEDLYHAALRCPPEGIDAFLQEACGEDEDVRREVKSLLRHAAKPLSLMDHNALSGLQAGSGSNRKSPGGLTVAHYEFEKLIGRGGMGEVYQATDLKLGRRVAIKVLPEAFMRDVDRLARLGREARLLASVNHPNIAAVYGLEQQADQQFLVMELVEGETLAEKIHRGPLAVGQALGIARQIAEALDAAHEKGIIHRDLKPANVRITPEGKVKVLDFGLAKAMEPPSSSAPSESATLTDSGTIPGMILGTPMYMSPEQSKGQTVDRRTDIFAFGCVLYEMLAGCPAFPGKGVSEILAHVLVRDPDWSCLPADVSSSVRKLLRRCLEKDVKKRRRDAGDVLSDLDEAMSETDKIALVSTQRSRLPWLLAAAAALSLAIFVTFDFLAKEPESPELRLEINTPPTPAPLDFALSPDGRYIAFVAAEGGPQQLWLRALDRTELQPLPGTDGATFPFWSADSRSVAYFTGGRLFRIDIVGGPPQPLANAPLGFGGTWNADGTVLFAATAISPIFRLSSSDVEPVVVTRLDANQASHRFPQFLPDKRHFVYNVLGTPEVSGVYLGSLDGNPPKRLAPADSSGAFLPPDRIVFQRQGSLMVQQLDLMRAELLGTPVRLADFAESSDVIGQGGFSVSADGHVAYRADRGGSRQLTWYDRSGRIVGVAGEPDSDNMLNPELSRDNQRVAVQRTILGNTDIWILDLTRVGMSRYTFSAAVETSPLWSPDGTRIVFRSNRDGPNSFFVGPAHEAGAGVFLPGTPMNGIAQDWSNDGRFLLYMTPDPKTGRDLWALPMTGNDPKPFVVANSLFEERNGQFSPDGRWLAYETNESGRFEIVVQSFPQAGEKWRVSTGGGIQPRWRPDGKELFFISPDGNLMAAAVNANSTSFAAGMPGGLFPARIAPSPGINKQQYAVSRNGQFLINQPVNESAMPITVILNWKPPED